MKRVSAAHTLGGGQIMDVIALTVWICRDEKEQYQCYRVW